MHFLNLIKTAQCCKTNSNSEQVRTPSEVIPVMMRDVILNETGAGRVHRMFTTNEYGLSPEMYCIIQAGTGSAVIAALFGGIGAMNTAKNDFLRRNVASAFESQHQAKRNLTDTISLAGIKNGWKCAVKYGSFSTLYLLGTMTVANYRNKVSIWEHVGCAALLGGLTRANYGVKGFLAAGGLGGFLGLIAGGCIILSMHFAGLDLEQLRYHQHEDYYARILKNRKIKEQKNNETKESH